MQKHGIVRTAALPAPPGPAAQIVAPSNKRVALLFSPPTAGSVYTVSTDPNVILGGGMNLLPTSGPVLVTCELFGDAVHKPWYGVASSAETIGFLETVEE